MEDNSIKYYQSKDISSSEDSIAYEFKPELIICNNDSESERDIVSENSGISSEKSVNQIMDMTIKKLLDNCTNKYKDLFYTTIMNEFIEEGYISDSQKLYKIIRNEYGDIVASLFLSNIYTENALNNKAIKSILYIILEVKPDCLFGKQDGILAYALLNKDYEIKDLALQCFEKWCDIEDLPLLKSMEIGVDYLDEYLKQIISQLEDEKKNQDVC